ncbi:MAG: AAA family ATPase [Armatimonadota bacterium]|nr:AAA family ATPase [Armatimonadota bacterium]
MNPKQEIETLIRAKYPILYVVTWEEHRVGETLEKVARDIGLKFYTWSMTQGMKPEVTAAQSYSTSKLTADLEALTEIHGAPDEAIFHLKDFHPYMKDSRVIRVFRDLAERLRGRSQTIVITAPILHLPTELEKEVSVIDFGPPPREEIEEVLDSVLRGISGKPGIDTNLTAEQRELLIKSCQGLTLEEVESVFARSLVSKRKLDVDIVLEEKKQIIRKSGVLEYYAASASLKDVGGMEHLKEWLRKRTRCFSDKAAAFGLPAPKGVLLLGVQGCGKSLVAKAIASHWELPMLRMDVGKVFGSLVGQSEENVRRAIQVAESVAPCVLWVDELEKGFAGVQGSGFGDSGTTARVFATFLTWMQEKTSEVFLIATANDVSLLPPELLRKGRFDEIFFIDLPDSLEREDIFSIHLSKRKRDPKNFDLKTLSKKTAGFSGAEIEQVVIAGLFSAFDKERELTQEDLVEEGSHFVPLSVMMREEIDALREWAKLRTRPASRNDDELPAPAEQATS